MRSQAEQEGLNAQPRDGLMAFHDADFVERWIKSEQHLNKILDSRRGDCSDTVSEDAEVLNTLFGTDSLGGKLVNVTGRVLCDIEPYEMRAGENLDGALFRYGQIKFIKVRGVVPSRSHTEQYRAAIKLLPAIEHAVQAPRYMLLGDAIKMEFPEDYMSTLSTDTLDQIFTTIIDDARQARSGKAYEILSMAEQREYINVYAAEFSRRLAPLIDHRVPVMLSANEYQQHSTKKDRAPSIQKVDTRELSESGQVRSMITGHLTRIAFSNATLNNIDRTPHMVIENSHTQTAYQVPLGTQFKMWTM